MRFSVKKFVAGLLLGLVPATALAITGYIQYRNSLITTESEYIFIPTEFEFKQEPMDFALGSNPTEVISFYNEQDDEKSAFVLAAAVVKETSKVDAKVVPGIPAPTVAPNSSQNDDNIAALGIIEKYATLYGVDAGIMKSIAHCESKYNPQAVSKSGAYVGLYQFAGSTWVSNRLAMGENPDLNLRLNAEEAAKTAAFKMSRDGYGAWPVCSQKALF